MQAATRIDLQLLAQSVSADALHFARDPEEPPLGEGEADAGKREGNAATAQAFLEG
jgi:hypothetical protein